jgi:hypothetical protein
MPSTPGDNTNGDTFAGGATTNCDAAIAAGGGIAIGTSAFTSCTAAADAAADADADPDTDADTDADAMDDNATAATARAGVSGLLTPSAAAAVRAAATAAAAALAEIDGNTVRACTRS